MGLSNTSGGITYLNLKEGKFARKNDKNEEYYIYFSEETVRKASELFFMNSNQNNATLEHKQKLEGMSVVESWIVEGKNDKSTNYGYNFTKGTCLTT